MYQRFPLKGTKNILLLERKYTIWQPCLAPWWSDEKINGKTEDPKMPRALNCHYISVQWR
jgi:hypothetical protein